MSNHAAKYSFISWVRQGIGLNIKEDDKDNLDRNPAGYNERVNIQVSVEVKGGTTVQTVSNTVKLIGPGDILGINKQCIVRTEPANWITNFEPNYLPYIEFYEEDFPWRYTPAKHNNQKLRPWIFLFVLEEGEFTHHNGSVLPYITITNTAALPSNPEQSWAWAHVHVNDELAADTDPLSTAQQNLKQQLADDADKAMSRLISPRMLKENKSYHAFLVPAFETGRRAGLGEPTTSVDAMLPSWGAGGTDFRFPVYHSWFFKTGATGDFEYLVRQLKPRVLDSKVGKREMDIQNPGYGLSAAGANGYVHLEGALMVPGSPVAPFGDLTFKERLQNLLNLPEDVKKTNNQNPIDTNPLTGQPIAVDPVVTPPMYGRWHALVNSVDAGNSAWVHQLNIDPRNRAAAGLGTNVVQKHQEEFMDIAWGQVGEIMEANKKLRQAEFAKEVSSTLHAKHIQNFSSEKLMAVTEPVQKKILTGPSGARKTIIKDIKEKNQPAAVESPAYRKLTRPGGSVVKRVAATTNVSDKTILQEKVIQQVYTTQVAAAAPKATPEVSIITQAAVQALQGSYSASGTDQQMQASYVGAVGSDLTAQFAVNVPDPVPGNVPVGTVSADIKASILPANAIQQRLTKYITASGQDAQSLKPVMAAPKFRQPMYEHLKQISPEYIIPNIGSIPNNTLTILQTNQKFVEAYMAGLNHEMARELLWREFPTDQRGTYFKQFWDVSGFVNTGNLTEAQLASITPMDTWGATALGTHKVSTVASPMVLLVRGDLLKKYPNTVIYAQKAAWQRKADNTIDFEEPRLLDNTSSGNIKYPLFQATIDPDIVMIGFDLDIDAAKGSTTGTNPSPGWYFLIKERPGQVRFGLDLGPAETIPAPTWNDLTWTNMVSAPADLQGNVFIDTTKAITASQNGGSLWGQSSADMAYILYQLPVVVGVHASEMIHATTTSTAAGQTTPISKTLGDNSDIDS